MRLLIPSLAALLLATPANAVTYQITGSQFTSCERNGWHKTPGSECSLTKHQQTVAPFDGWFSFDDQYIDTSGKLNWFTPENDGVVIISPDSNSLPASLVDFHLPWADRESFLVMSWNHDSSIKYWFLALYNGNHEAYGNEGSPDPNLAGRLERRTYMPNGNGTRIYLHGDSGHMTQIADGTGTLPMAPVPLPAAGLLLLGGIASIAAIRRRK